MINTAWRGVRFSRPQSWADDSMIAFSGELGPLGSLASLALTFDELPKGETLARWTTRNLRALEDELEDFTVLLFDSRENPEAVLVHIVWGPPDDRMRQHQLTLIAPDGGVATLTASTREADYPSVADEIAQLIASYCVE